DFRLAPSNRCCLGAANIAHIQLAILVGSERRALLDGFAIADFPGVAGTGLTFVPAVAISITSWVHLLLVGHRGKEVATPGKEQDRATEEDRPAEGPKRAHRGPTVKTTSYFGQVLA